MALTKCLQLKQIHYGHTCFSINIPKRDFSLKPHHMHVFLFEMRIQYYDFDIFSVY